MFVELVVNDAWLLIDGRLIGIEVLVLTVCSELQAVKVNNIVIDINSKKQKDLFTVTSSLYGYYKRLSNGFLLHFTTKHQML